MKPFLTLCGFGLQVILRSFTEWTENKERWQAAADIQNSKILV
jgi:hypothetical protein